MKIRIAFILALVFQVLHGFSQPKEYYFTLKNIGIIEVQKISDLVSIDKYENNTVTAYANDKQFEALKNAGYLPILETNPSMLRIPKMASSLKSLTNWDAYPTYDQYVALMKKMANDYPSLCVLDTIGFSLQNRAILVLKISDNAAVHEAEPEVLYSSSMHGDEIVGYALMLRLADYMLNNYGTNKQITSLVDSLQIFINPLANPDGTFVTGNNSVFGATRSNSNGVDLNRNFPDPIKGTNPDGNSTQFENTEMMNFMKKHHFVLSANFHGGAELANYPWDCQYKRHADDAWFQKIAIAYADTAQHFGTFGYFNDYSYFNYPGVTNGYDWYVVYGGRQDYVTSFLHGREVTFELSTTKLPSAVTLPDFWDFNYRSMIHYLENAFYGIHGTVTDYSTGKGIAAKIEIINHDDANSFVVAEPEFGYFVRMISPGTYSFIVSANGYNSETVENVAIVAKQKLNFNIKPVSLSENVRPTVVNEQNQKIYTLNAIVPPNKTSTIIIPFFDANGNSVIIESINKMYGAGSGEILFPNRIAYTSPTNYAATDTFLLNYCDNGTPKLCDKLKLSITSDPNAGIDIENNAEFANISKINSFQYEIVFDINKKTGMDIEIYDMLGKLVFQQKTKSAYTLLNTNEYAPGIYTLHLKIGNENLFRKITID